MAGGSLGAIFGSELAIRLSESYLSSGLELFILSSSILLFLAMWVNVQSLFQIPREFYVLVPPLFTPKDALGAMFVLK